MNADCINCYAEALAATRLVHTPKYIGLAEMTNDGPRWTGKVRLDEDDLLQPLRWAGRPRLVFVNAMSDLFYEDLGIENTDRIVAIMALTPQHTYQVLTKRWSTMNLYLNDPQTIERICRAMNDLLDNPVMQTIILADAPAVVWPLPNVWWGASMGHRAAVQDAMPHLAACRKHAAVLWVSAEPLIESTWDYLDFDKWLWKDCPICLGAMSVPAPGGGAPCPTCLDHQGVVPAGIIDWMVAGGESGKNARPTNLKLARQLRDDCKAAGVPFHFKQWGEWSPVTFHQIDNQYLAQNDQVYTLDRTKGEVHFLFGHGVARIGKKAAGRLLDGKQWDEWPRGFTPAGKASSDVRNSKRLRDGQRVQGEGEGSPSEG